MIVMKKANLAIENFNKVIDYLYHLKNIDEVYENCKDRVGSIANELENLITDYVKYTVIKNELMEEEFCVYEIDKDIYDRLKFLIEKLKEV